MGQPRFELESDASKAPMLDRCTTAPKSFLKHIFEILASIEYVLSLRGGIRTPIIRFYRPAQNHYATQRNLKEYILEDFLWLRYLLIQCLFRYYYGGKNM